MNIEDVVRMRDMLHLKRTLAAEVVMYDEARTHAINATLPNWGKIDRMDIVSRKTTDMLAAVDAEIDRLVSGDAKKSVGVEDIEAGDEVWVRARVAPALKYGDVIYVDVKHQRLGFDRRDVVRVGG